jgi:hypothetical protein
MSQSIPSAQLIKLLEITSGLILNLNLALPEFKRLRKDDYEYIFNIIAKPLKWEEMQDNEKIIYITRFNNGQKLRSIIK